jgi:hypothetical protein
MMINKTEAARKEILRSEEKTNLNPWIVVALLVATTVLTLFAGVFALSFVQNYRSQYTLEENKDSMQ